MKRTLLFAALLVLLSMVLAACGGEPAATQVIEVPGKTIVVEKEVIRTVEVPGKTIVVTKEVVKEVPVEVVVEKEVIREVIKEVVKEIRIPGETIVVTQEIAAGVKFGESPLLAQLVQAGKLPPVADRLPIPSDVMLIPAIREIGKYGGIIRKAGLGPGDIRCNMGKLSGMAPIRYTSDGSELLPHSAKSFGTNADGTVWTFHLRNGMKWSDGAPFTADDWLFSFEQVLLNDELTPGKPMWVRGPGPELAKMTKIDDFTVAISYPGPFRAVPRIMAWTCMDTRIDAYLPAHYVKQFHIDFNPDAEKNAKAAGFEGWVRYFKNRYDVRDNPDRPTNQPWMMENTRGDQVVWGTRNPYYFAVDQEFNQLPYIDKIRIETVASPQVILLKALQGEIDFQSRHFQLTDVPVLLQGAEKSGYRLALYPSYGGTDAELNFNIGYEGPEGILLRNKDFRIALSVAIDREFIKEVNFIGMGKIRNNLPPAGHPHYPGSKYETLHTEYDTAQANEILDRVMGPKDSQGFRTLPDGSRFEINIQTTSSFAAWPDIAEVVHGNWEKVGVRTSFEVMERSLFSSRLKANELMVNIFNFGLSADVFSKPRQITPVDGGNGEPFWGPAYGIWWATNGKSGLKPPPDIQRLIDIITIGNTLPPEESAKLAQEAYAWHAENQLMVGLVGFAPTGQGVTVVNSNMVNVPDSVANDGTFGTPWVTFPEQFWFRK